MSDRFIGEIQMFAGTFAPMGWAKCDGQLLQIAQYTALFSLVGTTYGGDGETTFGLPDLRGRIPVHQGTGPGLPSRQIGQKFGTHQVTLTNGQLPAHTHAFNVTDVPATSLDPGGNILAGSIKPIYGAPSTPVNLAADAVSTAGSGSGQAHNNMAPYLGVQFIIALTGLFPSM